MRGSAGHVVSRTFSSPVETRGSGKCVSLTTLRTGLRSTLGIRRQALAQAAACFSRKAGPKPAHPTHTPSHGFSSLGGLGWVFWPRRAPILRPNSPHQEGPLCL